MKKLPLSIQTFSEIVQKNYLYVDKTRDILELMTTGKYLFLSRPRRFGKSLLISTLKAIFAGQQDLFNGLFIYDQIEWRPHPVIHLDLSVIDYATPQELREGLIYALRRIGKEYHIETEPQGFKTYFQNILRGLAEKYDKVAVLIDEYDKPIIDFVDQPARAFANREVLKDFYGVLKGSDEYLRFVFLTGVSKFSRVSVFSGLNNLQDITLSPKFATLLVHNFVNSDTTFFDRKRG